ncbi:pyridoxal kinase [Bartonella sp. HY406]|uniref:pyridoxal kinase n=1 Tax=Bartonella sp. HY406 TaxID=2979331 RepID=UPI0021C6A513|nr:pyridoxal kinase [Bartonella sp. HY406]UXN03611.1 pyridoxal kinase [Bartonella sp. HY406]
METIDQGKTILLISSHVIRGTVGVRSSGFALETLGHHVWTLLTVTMTWQPRHGVAHRLNIPIEDFSAFADDIEASLHSTEIDAVMTGYFASAKQVEIAAQLIKKLKQKRPDLTYLCDPVMADEGGLYVREDIATAIKDHLVPLCNILKPNRSELEWMVGRKLDSNEDIIEAARSTQCDMVLITSAAALLKNATGNLLVHDSEIWLAEHRIVKDPVNGLGDLTSALFLSHYLTGMSAKAALQFTTASVFDCLCATLQKQSNELVLEQSYPLFMRPHSHITMRALSTK